MKNEWILPDGFDFLYCYPDGNTPVAEKFYGIKENILFYMKDCVPSFPLKGNGKILHLGWDIPTYWAIDKENQFWMSNGHGDCLMPTNQSSLLSTASEDEDELKYIKKLLGIEIVDEKTQLKNQIKELYNELTIIRNKFQSSIKNNKDEHADYHEEFAPVEIHIVERMQNWVERWNKILNKSEFESLKNEIK